MRAALPSVLGFIAAVVVGVGLYMLVGSKGVAGGGALIAAYVVWGELGDLIAGGSRQDKPAPGTPLLLQPAIRRRVLGTLALTGATGFFLLELLIGDVQAEDVRDWIQDLGVWGPILLITVLAVAMVIAPIPNPPFMIAAGIAWGTTLGVVYAVTGQLIGSAIIFVISRKFGRQFIPRLVGNEAAEKIDRVAKDMGPQIVFWWRMMPISFDFAAYAAGLTNMSFRLFIVLVAIGSIIPTTVVVGFGDSFDSSWTARGVSALLVMAGFLVPATIFYRRYRKDLPPPREWVSRLLAADEPVKAPQP